MNIVTEKEIHGRLLDGINTLLSLNNNDFEKVISLLQVSKDKTNDKICFYYSSDKCEAPNRPITLGLEDHSNSRCYFSNIPSMPEIFRQLSNMLNDKNEETSKRILEILNSRNIDALKSLYCEQNNVELVSKLFEILESPETLQRFLDYENNFEYFSGNDNSLKIQDYFRLLGNIFGNIKDNGELKNAKSISDDFYIPNLDSIIASVKDIYQNYNVDRYVDPKYEFKDINITSNYKEIIRKGDEPDFTINPKLKESISNGMPKNLSLEEQAMYIYVKLCTILEYDEEYMYRDKGISSEFKSTFSEEHLEQIAPKSKITCFDFSRLYAKLINELDGDIEAVIISEGANQGHFSVGFYTDKISTVLEAINIDGKKDPTNDLMKAKNGIKLRGIKPISDKTHVIDPALEKAYESIYGRSALSIKGFVQQIKSLPKNDIPDDLKLKLQSFIEVMLEKGITGNEFVQTLDGMYKSHFFGAGVEKAYLGRRLEQNGEKHIQRMVLFRQSTEDEQKEPNLFLIDTSTLNIVEPTSQQLIEKLNNGNIVYESEEHKIPGIDKEAQDGANR